MIITLKNADFSQSNVGNLAHWNISYNVGKGVTHSGSTAVKKDSPFSVIITIMEGYELDTAGVSVTMNNTLLTNAVTISTNSIAIDIPQVTGHIVIDIPTVASKINLLNLDNMSHALRYSPGGYNIVGNNGTKYGLYAIELEPNSTYELKISSGYTGGLFSAEPKSGSKTEATYNLNGSGAGTHVITTTSDRYWLALNVATVETADGGTTILTPNTAWQSALLYKTN